MACVRLRLPLSKREPDLAQRLRLPSPFGRRLPDVAAKRDHRATREQQGYETTDNQ